MLRIRANSVANPIPTGIAVGGNEIAVIAGPCSVESRSQIIETAIAVKEAGAFLCELEFQRYASRPALSKALAGCHLIQVVSGSAAWANAVLGLGVPVSLQVATRTVVDRRRLIEDAPLTPLSLWRRGMTFVADRLDDRALCLRPANVCP